MKKTTGQKMLGLGPEEMEAVNRLQQEWAKLSGLAVKKTDVMRVLLLIERNTPDNKVQALLRNSRFWYK